MPDDLQRIVRRCLAKEPDKRYQSIKEVAIELDELRHELKELAELDHSVQPQSNSAESAINSKEPNEVNTQSPLAYTTQTETGH